MVAAALSKVTNKFPSATFAVVGGKIVTAAHINHLYFPFCFVFSFTLLTMGNKNHISLAHYGAKGLVESNRCASLWKCLNHLP